MRLAEIAARAVKEIRYHQRHDSQWLIRLGDGTEESHRRVQQSIDNLWRYTGEMFAGDEIDDIIRDEYRGSGSREDQICTGSSAPQPCCGRRHCRCRQISGWTMAVARDATQSILVR